MRQRRIMFIKNMVGPIDHPDVWDKIQEMDERDQTKNVFGYLLNNAPRLVFHGTDETKSKADIRLAINQIEEFSKSGPWKKLYSGSTQGYLGPLGEVAMTNED